LNNSYGYAPVKNLLLLAYFFPPHGGGGVLRSVETVRLLSDHGWCSTVVAGPGEGYWVRDQSLLGRLPRSVKVVRTGALAPFRVLRFSARKPESGEEPRSEGAIRKWRRLADWLPVPDVYFTWAASAVRKSFQAASKADWIISTSPPESAHLAACHLTRRTGARWAADFRDPWVRGIYRKFPTALHRAVQRRLERMVVQGADLVLATSEDAVEDFRSRYPAQPEDKFQFIPNGFDPGEFSRFPHNPPEKEPLTIIHTGNLTLERNPVPLFRAIAALNRKLSRENPCCRIELAGLCDNRVREAAQELLPEDSITFSGYLPRGEVLKKLAGSHLGLLLESFAENAELVVPGKLYDYLGAGLPVLALVPKGAASRLVEQTGCGVAVTEPDSGRIQEILRSFLHRLRNGEQLHAPARQGELGRYERPAVVARLAELLSQGLAGL